MNFLSAKLLSQVVNNNNSSIFFYLINNFVHLLHACFPTLITMKNLGLIVFVLCNISQFLSQGRLVINDNSYIVLDNAAKIVIDNSNANAITIAGTGANIVSENASDQIVWNIGSSTGNYIIPWTTTPIAQGGNSTKIPFAMNITTGGNSGGQFFMSTYETSSDVNTPFPSGVTSLQSPALGMADASLYVIDRFWINDNSSYSTKPSATLSFNYDDASNELGGTNTALEANLQAQRWNATSGSWELFLFGTTNTTSNVTNGINVTSSDFWPIWTLVDLNFPLPATLGNQNAINSGCRNNIQWSTVTETNNDYFTINRSADGTSWFEVGRVDAAGNSSEIITYSFVDQVLANSPNAHYYYRIGQIDFDGIVKYYPTMNVEMHCTDFVEPSVYPNPFTNQVTVSNLDFGSAMLFDAAGRLVKNQTIDLTNNTLNLEFLASGMYQLFIYSSNELFPFKIIKK